MGKGEVSETEMKYWYFYKQDEYGEVERFIEAKDIETAVAELLLESSIRESLRKYDEEMIKDHLIPLSRDQYLLLKGKANGKPSTSAALSAVNKI